MRTIPIAPGVVAALLIAAPAGAQQDIFARDGDRIIVDEDARVEIVRRRQATVRTIFNQELRLLIVLVDYLKPGEFPDGQVDWAFNFYDVEGNWPLGERWEGLTTLFQYDGTPPHPRGLALETPQGLIHLVPNRSPLLQTPVSSALAVLSFRGAGNGPRRGLSFTETESLQLEDYARSKASGGTVSTSMGPSAPGSTGRGTGAASATFGTTSVGVIRGPSGALQKIRDVAPNYPDAARRANVMGVVILQLSVAPNGTVTDARILRSIPLLDAAAIEAAKQWLYAPTGMTAPITVTAAVNFTP